MKQTLDDLQKRYAHLSIGMLDGRLCILELLKQIELRDREISDLTAGTKKE